MLPMPSISTTQPRALVEYLSNDGPPSTLNRVRRKSRSHQSLRQPIAPTATYGVAPQGLDTANSCFFCCL